MICGIGGSGIGCLRVGWGIDVEKGNSLDASARPARSPDPATGVALPLVILAKASIQNVADFASMVDCLKQQRASAFVLPVGQHEPPFFVSPKKGDPKKGDPGKPPAAGGCAQWFGSFRRHIPVPTKTSPASLRATLWADPNHCAGYAGAQTAKARSIQRMRFDRSAH